MADTISPKRAALRERLLDIAEREVSEGGIVALRARDLAEEAGCALGSIYTAFGDLGEIAIAVNRRTLENIIENMSDAIEGMERDSAQKQLEALALAYAGYALEQGPRWRTLFAVGLPETADEPSFFDAFEPVADLFAGPLEDLHPAHTRRKLNRNARTLFAAIHGLVVLGQEERIATINPSDLKRSVSALVVAAADENGSL